MEATRNLTGEMAQARGWPVAKIGRVVAAICIMLDAAGTQAAENPAGPVLPEDFSRMSLEDLANVEISSVSKRPERLSDAAAAVFVISREDIRRSGYTRIPEILRLAPNLQVARVDANQYAISARGFNSTTANKLLVLIDGRSVYTPLFSGVFWDVQDTMIEDIERIEVISGAGGTLWGANAVNGVINIITRSSKDTIGGLVSIGGGDNERGAAVRYGGRINENATFRVYAKGFDIDNTVRANGTRVKDSWNKQQGGFRVDWSANNDAITLQGDVYDGSLDQPVNSDRTISGGNLLARLNRNLGDNSSLQIQAYYDNSHRKYPGSFAEELNTYDLDIQHRFKLADKHDIVWGGGYRSSRDEVTNTATLAFLPATRDLHLGNIFLQDSIALTARLQFTAGAKLEHNNYTGMEFQPNARLAWKLDDKQLLWAAVSKAVRTPSRLDRDLFAPGTAPFLLAGGRSFDSEKLTAYEIGYRVQPNSRSTLSISTFYNEYDHLRSLESPPTALFPLVISNKMEGNTSGVEIWGTYGISDWWRLSAGYNYLHKNLRLQSDSRDFIGIQAAGNDPSHQVSLRSQMDLARNLELDIGLRSIDNLPNPSVPSYVALDARLGWIASKNLELSITGFNLLDKRHPEFGSLPGRSELERSVYGKIVWKF